MEWLDILRRIEGGESRHTEFKRGLGDLSAVGKAMCAFANTEGGVIVLGVTDAREIMRRAMRAFNATEPDMIQNGRSRFVRVTFRLHGEAA